MKRSYAFPRKLIYKSIPLAMAGLLSCGGGGGKTSSNDGSPSMTADLAGTCPVIDDMGDRALAGTCFASNGSNANCPTFACSQADCPNGCDFEVLA